MYPYIFGAGEQKLDLYELSPGRITTLYLLFGFALLAFSDVLLPVVIPDSSLLRQLQAVKGAIEVSLTAGLIYALTGRLDRQIRESNTRYRNLIENSPAPINLFDEDGEILWGNDAFIELLGLESLEDVVGRSVTAFAHPDDLDVVKEERADVMERGERTGPTDVRLQRDDGETRHVYVSTTPGWYQNTRAAQAVVVDVTDLRETEAALRRERNFVRNALDELRDVFFVVDSSGELVRWNARLSDVTGLDDAELASSDVTDFFESEELPRIRESIESVLETGTAFVETDLVTAEGDRPRYEFKTARLAVPDDEDRIVGIGRDVTDHKRMERELRENEQRYRTLVEMSPYAIVVHSDGEIVYANESFVDLVEASTEDDVRGESITTFVPPDEREDVERSARRTQRGDEAASDVRRTVVTLDGAERFTETTSRAIAYEDEPAVLTTLKDVTHRHRYEEMLTTLHERTRAMARAESRRGIAEIALETSAELLDVDRCVVYEFDGHDELEPIAWSEAREGESGPPVVRRGDGVLWEAFADGETKEVEGRSVDDALLDARDLSVAAHPLDNHGLLVICVEDASSLTGARGKLLNLIRENLTAAFDRAEREHSLRDRDRKLAEQNETLEQLNRLNEIIRDVNQTLVRSSTRSEILEATCERITAAEQYSCAWVGTQDSLDDPVEPQHWAGMDTEFVAGLGSPGDQTPLQELSADALREGASQTAQNVLDDPAWSERRTAALNQGYRSVIAVPIRKGDYVESVLVIHAKDDDIFDEQERSVLEELGLTIGYALRNVERSQAVDPGERTELELEVGDEALITNRITGALDVDLEFVGAVPGEGDELQLFVRLAGAHPEDVQEALSAMETVTTVQPLAVEDDEGVEGDEGLYRLSVSVPPLVGILQRNGVSIRSLSADDGRSTLVAVLPGRGDARSVVEALESAYPETELLARREGAKPVDSRETFRDRVRGQLTDRQEEALQTAYYAGFYEWPRETNSEDLAEMLDIASSTYQYHLRAAERTLVSATLEPA